MLLWNEAIKSLKTNSAKNQYLSFRNLSSDELNKLTATFVIRKAAAATAEFSTLPRLFVLNGHKKLNWSWNLTKKMSIACFYAFFLIKGNELFLETLKSIFCVVFTGQVHCDGEHHTIILFINIINLLDLD